MPEHIKSEVREAIAEVQKALDDGNIDAIKSASDQVALFSQAMGTAVYQHEQALQSGGVDPGVQGFTNDEGAEDEIIDESAGQAVQTESDRNGRADVASAVPVLSAYSHKDERYRQALDISLSQLKRNGIVSVWHDRKILPGQEWGKEIDQNLETADIVLVLVSPDFLASDYAYTREMKRAIERHHAGLTTVIPVILRPSDWQNSPLGELQALPGNGRPISMWPKRDQAWLNVVHGLRQLLSDR